jgi:alkyl hydroperoxide reductase subunit AhpF
MMTERLLNDDITRQVTEFFQQLQEPVEVLYFGRKDDCDYCDDTRHLLEELVETSDMLALNAYDLEDDAGLAEQYRVDKVPGIVIAGRDGDQILDYGIRYSGIPAGHEFSSLINTMVLVSSRDSGLDLQTRQVLAGLKKPVHLQVFVTPT